MYDVMKYKCKIDFLHICLCYVYLHVFSVFSIELSVPLYNLKTNKSPMRMLYSFARLRVGVEINTQLFSYPREFIFHYSKKPWAIRTLTYCWMDGAYAAYTTNQSSEREKKRKKV